MQINVYPSGFGVWDNRRAPAPALGQQTTVVQVPADPDVQRIFTTAVRVHLHNLTSEDKLELVELARDLFGDFDQFVQYNIVNNRRIHGQAFDFLADTVNFINGGVRTISTSMWATLVEQNPKIKPYGEKPNYTVLPKVGSNYIVRWLSQPSGIDDLLYTMSIMFGGELEKPQPANKTGLFLI